jgi:hypothetical protein
VLGGVAVTLHSWNLPGETTVHVDFTIQNLAVSPFVYNPLNTSLQTEDGRRWNYASAAYTSDMRLQPILPQIETGDLIRVTEGYIIPRGPRPVKFFYSSYGGGNFSFALSSP